NNSPRVSCSSLPRAREYLRLHQPHPAGTSQRRAASAAGTAETPAGSAGEGRLAERKGPLNISYPPTGLPAMLIPCGFTRAALPIGLQVIGRPFEEARLLQVAHGYEAVSPSRQRRSTLVEASYKAGRTA